MPLRKKLLGCSVLDAARDRVSRAFDDFDRIYVSFSGGKDSTVMLHLVAEEARRRGRKFGLLFVDLEAQYRLTIEHIERCFRDYADCSEPYWLCLPIALRNAVSQYQPKWQAWEPGKEADWVRKPPKRAITDGSRFPWFYRDMEFEDLVDEFGLWYGQGKATCCFVGIRSAESLNRWRTLAAEKTRWKDYRWTTWKGDGLFNAYPIYDWRAQDIWTYHGKYNVPHNRIYDLMHKAGLTIHQQRICQPYGDDQRKGLWLYQILEPETWAKILARVNGANSGALYAQEHGNINGTIKVTLPEGHTWESFSKMILATMPEHLRTHFTDKITVFLKWYEGRGYPNGIPDYADPKDEAARTVPSWRRIAKTLLRNDYWCKGLSFTQQKSGYYQKYRKIMERRRREWQIRL